MAELNASGVKVRYQFYPRAGVGSESWQKAQSVWCAKDRKAALTDAKAGKPIVAATCANPPIGRQFELGQALGLDGTPLVSGASWWAATCRRPNSCSGSSSSR
jgi:thiol:disulfide interchange protein DsbC